MLYLDVETSVEAAARQTAEGAVKTWEDLDRYRAVFARSKPDVIIECGTFKGGSARWFASMGIAVISIDNVPRLDGAPDGVTLIVGDSASGAVIAEVAELVAGRRAMAVLDSDHSAHHVKAEIAAYGPLVSPGCYLVVEDGITRWIPSPRYEGSPLDAIEELLAGSEEWQRDEEIEAMYPVTMHPMGWWKRAR